MKDKLKVVDTSGKLKSIQESLIRWKTLQEREMLSYNDELEMIATLETLTADNARLQVEVVSLKGSIRQLGEMGDVCTYNDLKEICSYCRCKRKPVGAEWLAPIIEAEKAAEVKR